VLGSHTGGGGASAVNGILTRLAAKPAPTGGLNGMVRLEGTRAAWTGTCATVSAWAAVPSGAAAPQEVPYWVDWVGGAASEVYWLPDV
jgi:hypothetical protein